MKQTKQKSKSVRLHYSDNPIFQCKDFEYGIQTQCNEKMNKKFLYFIRFYEILTIDVDAEDGDNFMFDKENITKKLHEMNLLKGFMWIANRTTHGYHLMLVSHAVPHYSNTAIKTMFKYPGADKWYTNFCIHNAYKVRVSPKFDGEHLQFYNGSFIIGEGASICKDHVLPILVMNELKKHHEGDDTPFNIRDFISGFEDEEVSHQCITSGNNNCSFYNSFIETVLKSNFMNDNDVIEAIAIKKAELVELANASGRDGDKLQFKAKSIILKELKNQNKTDCSLLHKFQVISMNKPQRILKDSKDFYVAVDVFTNTLYVCFRNLLMVDLDEPLELKDVIQLASRSLNAFMIHKTKKGWHIFDVSKDWDGDYASKESRNVMKSMKCDANYIQYAIVRGWCVRLNKKSNECRDPNVSIYSNVYDGRTEVTTPEEPSGYVFGKNPQNALTELVHMVDMIFELTEEFKYYESG
jgi:hypothetical protein